ncbi:hypothetical protein ECDEC12E_1195 [Escherichia coli DEC12E]|nr:hypothetical protein ECDEC12E_1195 [Escherichia coli DEC12E]
MPDNMILMQGLPHLAAIPLLRTRSSARALPRRNAGNRAASALCAGGNHSAICPPNPAPPPL